MTEWRGHYTLTQEQVTELWEWERLRETKRNSDRVRERERWRGTTADRGRRTEEPRSAGRGRQRERRAEFKRGRHLCTKAEWGEQEGCGGQGMGVWRGRWWPPTLPRPGRHLRGSSWMIQGPRREKPQACI